MFKRFIPNFLGSTENTINLENLIYGCEFGSCMDIKIGKIIKIPNNIQIYEK
jgi:hypothetical protein